MLREISQEMAITCFHSHVEYKKYIRNRAEDYRERREYWMRSYQRVRQTMRDLTLRNKLRVAGWKMDGGMGY